MPEFSVLPTRSQKLALAMCAFALVFALANTASAADDLIMLEEAAFAEAAATVAPAVVRIETIGGDERVGKLLASSGPSTGLIVSADGYIISSQFNFAQRPSSILVTLPGGNRIPARIVARDHSRLLVLLKVDADEPLPLPFAATADQVRIGQWALAIGRGDEAEQANVSVGIVSAMGRIFGKAIQTDAKISPRNYGGPLIDLQGRVLGVLVPMSPQGGGVVAGFEWYDGGIGFAVPLDSIQAVLPRLAKGEDLHQGQLGVGLKNGDPFTTPGLVASVRPRSPALDAGFAEGDQIVQVDGKPVATQMQLRIALGPRYAGETVRFELVRGGKKLEVAAELVAELPEYAHPYLGLLPERLAKDDLPPRLVVRHVFSASPAAAAGIKSQDQITALGETEIDSASAARDALASLEPGDTANLTILRGGDELKLEVKTSRVSSDVPAKLPAPRPKTAPAAEPFAGSGASELQLPELPNKAVVYVPKNYDPNIPHGVLIWLHASGGDSQEELLARFQPLCEERELILLAPRAQDPRQWKPDEVEFARKALDAVIAKYSIDTSRIVAHGYQAGGAMAYLLWMKSSDLVSGVAPLDAPAPRGFTIPDNDPQHRVAILTGSASSSRFAKRIEEGVEAMQTKHFPVTQIPLGEKSRYFNREELELFARWIDALDRF